MVVEPGGIVFGKYEVVRKLGEGGMGAVWLVRDVDLDVERALKLIRRTVGFDSDAFARFRREARLMAKITHVNGVAVHDSRLDQNDVAYIVMEYVPGKSLEKILTPGKPMPLEWVARVLKQLCDVLQTAHDHGIVHRDLKPSNLMLLDGCPPGQEHLKVLDFGIAKVIGSEGQQNDAHTVVGAFMGTPPYTSPEQAEGQADLRSDLYSVGVILYEMLTGRRPFTGSHIQLLVDTLHKPPRPFATTNPNARVPAEVERVVMRCLAKRPDDRPQTARALADEFHAALGSAGVQAGTIAPARARRLTPILIWLAGASLLSAVVVFGLPRLKKNPSTSDRQPPLTTPKSALNESKSIAPRSRIPAGYHASGKVYLPTGYRPAEDAGLVEGRWPRVIVRDDGTRFIRIPAGSFAMGAAGPEDAHGSNEPARTVGLDGFYVQELEVTNEEMRAFIDKETSLDRSMVADWRQRFDKMKAALGDKDAARHPASCIPWSLAAAFAEARLGRLPTEAQWEFAARSGAETGARIWSKDLEEMTPIGQLANLNYSSQNDFGTATGGAYQNDVTSLGVKDLVGNVREWCRDVARPYAVGTTPETNPAFPPSRDEPNPLMIVRGGSFKTPIEMRFVTDRGKALLMTDQAIDVGFRLVIECPAEAPEPSL